MAAFVPRGKGAPTIPSGGAEMTIRTLPEADVRASDHAPAAPTLRSHPVVLALTSALLLFGAFPPAGWSWLGWVALAPLFLLLHSERSRRGVYPGGWRRRLAVSPV